MAHQTKRQKASRSGLVPNASYVLEDALSKVKTAATAKFDESVDIVIRLGIDPRKSDQNVRGSIVLPHGTGKILRVAVFAQGDKADEAKQAGADIVGFEDLVAKVKAGEMDFDRCIATPDAMKEVGKLGQVLGPRGLMPNPRVGTVTMDIAKAVKNAKAGEVQYRCDKAGIVHCTVGKASFDVSKLKENIQSIIADVIRVKPSTAKGTYIRKVCVSSTMGPGFIIELGSLPI